MQARDAPSQRALPPRQGLQARRVAGVGALALARQPRTSLSRPGRASACHASAAGAKPRPSWHTASTAAAAVGRLGRASTGPAFEHARCPGERKPRQQQTAQTAAALRQTKARTTVPRDSPQQHSVAQRGNQCAFSTFQHTQQSNPFGPVIISQWSTAGKLKKMHSGGRSGTQRRCVNVEVLCSRAGSAPLLLCPAARRARAA